MHLMMYSNNNTQDKTFPLWVLYLTMSTVLFQCQPLRSILLFAGCCYQAQDHIYAKSKITLFKLYPNQHQHLHELYYRQHYSVYQQVYPWMYMISNENCDCHKHLGFFCVYAEQITKSIWHSITNILWFVSCVFQARSDPRCLKQKKN